MTLSARSGATPGPEPEPEKGKGEFEERSRPSPSSWEISRAYLVCSSEKMTLRSRRERIALWRAWSCGEGD